MPRRNAPRRASALQPRALDRREFIRHAAIASIVAAEAVATPSRLGAAGTSARPNGGVVWKKAPCTLCAVGCGLLVGSERGRAVAIKGDPQSPVSRGLACVKGYHAAQGLHGPDRIERALVRRDGKLVPVRLTEAFDRIAERMRSTVARFGKDSIAMYGSAQWTVTDASVASKLFTGALGTNNVGTSARLDHASAAFAMERAFGASDPVGCHEDVDHADVFVLWDVNLAETDPVLFSRMLERRRTNPSVRIVDLSTRTTRTSYAADQSLSLVPGSEHAIAQALSHEIIARRWTHRAFVDRHVAFKKAADRGARTPADRALVKDSGTDATWNDYVNFLAKYTPDAAARVSGVPAERIRWLASLYGDRSRKVISVWGAAVNRRPGGVETNTAVHNLHLLVGKIASPGNGAFYATASGVAPDGIDAAPGTDALAMFRALESGAIRFLWIQGANPMASLPNLQRYRAAASLPDRFLVVSEAYPTATTEVADVVLPAAMWVEREGVIVNSERRAQHFARMVNPPRDATSDGWQMIEVARRLGFAKLFPSDATSQVEEMWEELRRSRAGPDRALPSIAELRAQPGIIWPFLAGNETRWRHNGAHDPAVDRSRGSFDFYGHADHRAWIWLRPPVTETELPDASYPFRLETGAVLEHSGTGTVTRRIPALRRAMPAAYVEMNREDARRLGIRDGARVRVVSRRGAIEAEARVERRSQPRRGSVFVPMFDDALAVNVLTLDRRCPLSGQAESGACAVRIERLERRKRVGGDA